MAPAIPDRWTDYKPVGEQIEGTRFIAFKVPLKEHVAQNVDDDIRLDGKILLNRIPKLGLIIDLTNTNRYYNPQFFENEGVKHKKLMTPGHVTPPKHIVDKFKMIVNEFIENNIDNDKLIGVHCTHGVNRTGYLICNYMISQMTMEPNDAMARFSNARGHKIERNNYIDALQKLLGNAQQTAEVEPIYRSDTREQNMHNNNRDRDYYHNDRSPRKYHNRYENSRQTSRSRSPHTSRSRSPHTGNFYADNNRNNNYYSYRNQPAAEYNRSQPQLRSFSPTTFYGNNNRRNDYFNYRRPFGTEPPHQAQRVEGQLMNANANNYQPPYQPPSLRLDYYNTRPTNGRERYNTHVQRTAHNTNRDTHNF